MNQASQRQNMDMSSSLTASFFLTALLYDEDFLQ